jgi:hypothetical protein
MENQPITDYRSLEKQLGENDKKLKSGTPKVIETPPQKAVILLRYIRRKEIKKMPPYKQEGMKKYYIPEAERKIKIYSKEDIKDAITYRLNQLEREGLNSERKILVEENENFEDKRNLTLVEENENSEYGNPEIKRNTKHDYTQTHDTWAYNFSLDWIKDIQDILSNRKLLRKKGILRKERKEYEGTFKNIVNTVLKQGEKYATTSENIQSMKSLLEYSRKNKLVPKKIRGNNKLEKKLTNFPQENNQKLTISA